MTTEHDNEHGKPDVKQTSEYDVSILREARRIVEKYLHLSHVRMYQAMDELDNAIDLIEAPTEPAPSADNQRKRTGKRGV